MRVSSVLTIAAQRPLLSLLTAYLAVTTVREVWRCGVRVGRSAWVSLGEYIGKDPRDYVFGDVTRASVGKAASWLSWLVDKDLSEYHFGEPGSKSVL